MSDSPLDLDLKFLPDWLKESDDKNPYADYAGEAPRRDFDRRGGGDRGRGPNRGPGGRPGGGPGQGARGPQARSGSRDDRGPRRSFSGPKGPRDPQSRPGDRPRPTDSRPPAPRQEEINIPLSIEFLPEPGGIAALAKQIKTSHRAYPLYGLGRMFLNKPERHRVRVSSNAPAYPLFQVGEGGPVTTHRASAERDAFRQMKNQYYVEETTQTEPPKGNFASVARCRLSGVLLGPTSHHSYQLALRKLYEARFSRRMDFNEFLRQIEIVNDPAVVEEWKKQVSTVTVFRTTQEAEPVEFKSLQEVEAHFRATYLEKVVRCGKTMEMSGVASRNVSDRQIRDGIRAAWEKERAFPAQTVNRLRPNFQEAGLHIWKYRKRILFVSAVRPVRFGSEARSVSDHIASLLNVIETSAKCSRTDIFNQLLKPHEAEEDFAKLKAAMASDLHWLIGSGHVIEFHDGILGLPLAPKEEDAEARNSGKPEPKEEKAVAEASVAAETSVEAAEAPVVETPVVEAPVVEAPVVEAPVVEAPVVEAPVVEAPVVEAPVVECSNGEGDSTKPNEADV